MTYEASNPLEAAATKEKDFCQIKDGLGHWPYVSISKMYYFKLYNQCNPTFEIRKLCHLLFSKAHILLLSLCNALLVYKSCTLTKFKV